MKKQTLGVIIGVVCSGLIVGIVLATKPGSNSNSSQATKQIAATTVSEHNSSDDCWLIINNSVYDVTEYVRKHPGGKEIVRGCGRDATTLFNTRRDGDERVGSGTSHSSNAKSTLESFKIGVLAN